MFFKAASALCGLAICGSCIERFDPSRSLTSCRDPVNPHGIIEQANRAAVELLKSARDFIVGQPLAVFINKGDKTAFYRR